MVIEYRGKRLNIPDKLIEDYNRFNPEFNQDVIDECIYKKYIWDKTRENEIAEIAKKLDNIEIENTVKHALKFVNGFYYQDRNYGDSLSCEGNQ